MGCQTLGGLLDRGAMGIQKIIPLRSFTPIEIANVENLIIETRNCSVYTWLIALPSGCLVLVISLDINSKQHMHVHDIRDWSLSTIDLLIRSSSLIMYFDPLADRLVFP